MLIQIIRALFVLIMAAIGYAYIADPEQQPLGHLTWTLMALAVIVAVTFVCIDILSPRKKLQVFAGTFFGLLVGVLIAWALSFVIPLIVTQLVTLFPESLQTQTRQKALVEFLTLLVGAVAVYLSISFVLQTKDDFRFIVPYVEFARQAKGSRPMLLDTSALIDGRIADVAETGIFDVQLIVPRFVLVELQAVADSADRLKRNRGRRGLDVVARLQKSPAVDVVIFEASHHEADKGKVDEQLMLLAKELGGRVLTTDFNLNKVAKLTGVDVININDMANALKPEVLPGEPMHVKIIRPGEEASQGVGFLDDGTMVVVEHARARVGEDVEFIVTNTRQTSAGRMIFGRIPLLDGTADDADTHDAPPPPSQRQPHRRGDRNPPPRNRERSN
jgi:uncharacterized protein YacL